MNSGKDNKHSVPPNVNMLTDCSLTELMNRCAEKGMNNILVEAGHKLAGSFLKEDLVDEIVIYIAAKLMGNNAMGLFDINVSNMSDCPELSLQSLRQFGDDIRLVYQPKK